MIVHENLLVFLFYCWLSGPLRTQPACQRFQVGDPLAWRPSRKVRIGVPAARQPPPTRPPVVCWNGEQPNVLTTETWTNLSSPWGGAAGKVSDHFAIPTTPFPAYQQVDSFTDNCDILSLSTKRRGKKRYGEEIQKGNTR
ncbi:hypothetical protein QBC38DRAFT_45853 [Podospora fimiseda]|uniref:Secreted protein n=1 Tax=Podospora fimiseda TaxID=252190 RepID=A0AAN7GP24_9PEZI|nr:hypothetical protein QBC38DRAFT_45853 [Podospora fimiseda]